MIEATHYPESADADFGHREGWWLSMRSDGAWEIQAFDESSRFKTDAEALAFCRQSGEAAAKEALALHGTGALR